MGKAVLIAAALMLVAGNNARGDELFPAPTNPAPPAKTEPPPPAPGPGKIEVPPLPPGVEPNVADDPLLQMRLCLTHRLRGAISQQCRCPRDPPHLPNTVHHRHNAAGRDLLRPIRV